MTCGQITIGEAPILDPALSSWRSDWYYNEGGTDNDPQLHTRNHLLSLDT